jgi:asparagine synthase (glutamine-hydrolysing)
MCGICGLVDYNHKSAIELPSAVRLMANRLVHRGPDAEGFWQRPGVALGHRRLSIIDLAGSIQPMQDPSGRYILVFNGEIYNYLELRSDLKKRGIRFRTKGDTEVLLAAFITYGPGCLEHLNGMFAFAVWDRQEQVLFAARDRMGIKPLFFGQGRGSLMAFASELQSLRGLPLDFSIRPSALVQYLRYGFIRSPDTIFQGVQELRPAHFLRYSQQALEVQTYWEPPLPDSGWKQRPESELAEELRNLVRSAVQFRLRSDVPLGVFLSGGLDSSTIVAAMRDLGKTDIHSFAIGFEETSFDESPFAKQVADFLSTVHHESRKALRAGDLLFDLVCHYGQPYGDSSAIPTWHLCQETRRHVTVALSGDGGDELFCGYRRYVARRLLAWYQKLPQSVRKKCLAALIKRLPEGTAYYDHSLIKKLRLFVDLDQRVTEDPNDIYPAFFKIEDLTRLLNPEQISMESMESMDQKIEMLADEQMNSIELMMRLDILHYLPDDILTKVDRASMAHSLEVRSPFMDYRVVEFACRLPLRFKLKGLTTKHLLRMAFAEDLPSEPLKRQKHGFAVPMGDWFQGPLKAIYEDVVLSSSMEALVNKEEARQLLKEHQYGRTDHGHRLWLLLFLHAWYQWWQDI